MDIPIITGHSGCEQTPRDSMESIERAIACGADAVEMDVRRAPDGTLYISHDRQTQEGTAKKPTLEDVFRRLRDTRLMLNCDIKEPFALCGALDLAAGFGFGPERLIVTGYVSPEQLALEPAIAERAGVFLNVEEVLKFIAMGALCAGKGEASFPQLMRDAKPFVLEMLRDGDFALPSLIRLTHALGARGLNLPHAELTSPLFEALDAEGILCSVWTVNEPAELERCLRLGVYNITTLCVRAAVERRRICCRAAV